MVCVRLIILCLWLSVTLAAQAAAEDFLVSTDPTGAEQNNPTVAVGHDGKFAVAWADFRNGDGDLYVQRFDSGAIAAGYNILINDDGQGAWQFDPDLTADWYGNYYLVWKDYRNNKYPFDPDIYFQKMDSLGPVGENINITVEQPDSSHQSPAAAASGWGKTIVTWSDLRHNHWDIFTQTLDSSGARIGANILVNDDLASAPQHEPAVALSAEGWFVVVWYDGRNGDDDIYIQKFDSSGQTIGTNLKVNDDGGDSKQKFPSVAIGGNGVIYVVWTDWRRGQYPANPDIFGQRLNAEMMRLGANFNINQDNTHTAQREPRVSADRMGNACVVWSDSSGGDWNITAQMIEYSGEMRDDNFRVNQDSSGVQHFPDVALDGYDLYLVWADNRRGDFDIYGRLYNYNDPALQVLPSRVEFSKDKLDPDPDPVMINLKNAAYGELDYSLVAEDDWITISKDYGSTPDSFRVGINSATLDYGTHMGFVRLIDISKNDSTSLLPVLVTITGPLLKIAPDSLDFRALVEVGSPAEQNISITNSGSGTLSWQITTTAGWITIDKSQGTANDIVPIGCDVSSLITGEYAGYIIISDDGALNSPDSLPVSLTLQSNLAYLSAEPDNLYREIIWGETAIDSIRITNLGGAESNWRADGAADWFEILPDSGGDNDFIVINFNTAELGPGHYSETLIVKDSLAFNNPLMIPIIADIVIGDTLFIPPAQGLQGEPFQIPLYLRLHNEIKSGFCELRFDPVMMTIDSVLYPKGDLDGRISAVIDTGLSRLAIEIMYDSTQAPLGVGEHHLVDLYLTANDSLTGTTSLTSLPEDSFYLESVAGVIYRPILESHETEISSPTAVDDRETDQNPALYSLDQNYPNPFNGRTEISFNMPHAEAARLEIFNILGQRLAVVVDAYLPAGSHEVVWNAKTQDGAMVASGLYFYKFSTPGFSDVKKMVYLK